MQHLGVLCHHDGIVGSGPQLLSQGFPVDPADPLVRPVRVGHEWRVDRTRDDPNPVRELIGEREPGLGRMTQKAGETR